MSYSRGRRNKNAKRRSARTGDTGVPNSQGHINLNDARRTISNDKRLADRVDVSSPVDSFKDDQVDDVD